MPASDHSADMSSSVSFGGNAVYLQVNGKDILEIFPIRYSSTEGCRFTASPTEKGTEKIDSKFRLPTVVSFSGLIKAPHYSKLATISDSIKSNKKEFCIFYGKDGSVEKMLVEKFDKTGNNSRLDAIEISVQLREYIEYGDA